MRYVAALCYALAIAAHTGALLNTLMLGGLVFGGTVAVLFALEGIIKDAVRPRETDLEFRARVGLERLRSRERARRYADFQ